MAVKRKSSSRSAANRAYYAKPNNRRRILKKAKSYYKSHRAKILARQRKYRMKTKAGTSAYKPLYMRGARGGKRPLYARLPRLNAYSFVGRKRGKNSKALGRKSAGFRKGTGSNVGRKPRSGGRAYK